MHDCGQVPVGEAGMTKVRKYKHYTLSHTMQVAEKGSHLPIGTSRLHLTIHQFLGIKAHHFNSDLVEPAQPG